jgi:hypothetical protein
MVHRDHDDHGLFISDPIRSRLNDEWAIILSRRVAGPGGGFAGVITAVIDPAYFAALFRTAANAGTRVALVNRSGMMLSSTADDFHSLSASRCRASRSTSPLRIFRPRARCRRARPSPARIGSASTPSGAAIR